MVLIGLASSRAGSLLLGDVYTCQNAGVSLLAMNAKHSCVSIYIWRSMSLCRDSSNP
ncbi:hypothetical protein EMIT0347P_20127 [Pseudomonas sp. IT-347P]